MSGKILTPRTKILAPANVPILILAGGLGTRLSEETHDRPKPMIEIGRIPLITHVMRHYYAHGFNDFVICAGYRALEIKKYFLDYRFHLYDVEIDQRRVGDVQVNTIARESEQEAWRVRVLDTGEKTMTGGRVVQALDFLKKLQPLEHFGLTYGDGLSDVDLTSELSYHLSHGGIGTVLGTKNNARYGELDITSDGRVAAMLEKPESRQGMISGGFFFFSADFRKYLSGDADQILERQPLSRLAEDGKLFVHKHTGFWYACDTLRDKTHLESLWASGNPPWVVKVPLKKAA